MSDEGTDTVLSMANVGQVDGWGQAYGWRRDRFIAGVGAGIWLV